MVVVVERRRRGGWSGLVWSGLVWSGLVWSGLVWSGLVWSGLVWSGLVAWHLVWMQSLGKSERDRDMYVVFTKKKQPGGRARAT